MAGLDDSDLLNTHGILPAELQHRVEIGPGRARMQVQVTSLTIASSSAVRSGATISAHASRSPPVADEQRSGEHDRFLDSGSACAAAVKSGRAS